MKMVLDGATFRRILGYYPTGVCAVTSHTPEAGPSAMIIGSFTSVSLDPPLVAFFPDKKSTSWPKIAETKRFCVNILADCQERMCHVLSSKAANKFDDISFRLSHLGSPILEGALAWIDCEIYAVHEAGDHFIAIGLVDSLDTEQPGTPLLFHKGAYGKMSPM